MPKTRKAVRANQLRFIAINEDITEAKIGFRGLLKYFASHFEQLAAVLLKIGTVVEYKGNYYPVQDTGFFLCLKEYLPEKVIPKSIIKPATTKKEFDQLLAWTRFSRRFEYANITNCYSVLEDLKAQGTACPTFTLRDLAQIFNCEHSRFSPAKKHIKGTTNTSTLQPQFTLKPEQVTDVNGEVDVNDDCDF